MTPDRRTLNVLLAALELEQNQLADLMGYEPGYVANVFNGNVPASVGLLAVHSELRPQRQRQVLDLPEEDAKRP